MPRNPRFFMDGVPHHVTHRGNNRQVIFFDPEDGRRFREWLADYALEYGCAVHAYVLMPNHVHLLVTPATAQSLPKMMQMLSARYSQYVNNSHARSGALWEGRYHASLIDSDAYLLACYRYIELNPVRAGLAEGPESYLWSSYRSNCGGDHDPLLSPHPLFQALIDGPEGRQVYRRFVGEGIGDQEYEQLHHSSLANGAVGNSEFVARVEREIGRSLSRRRGRPRKVTP